MFSIASFSDVGVPVVLAADAAAGLSTMWMHLLAAIVFSLVGVGILGACFLLMKKLTPFSVVKEIEQDQNVALAVVMGSFILGMSLIIAAAILG